jgi:hypothetical protein
MAKSFCSTPEVTFPFFKQKTIVVKEKQMRLVYTEDNLKNKKGDEVKCYDIVTGHNFEKNGEVQQIEKPRHGGSTGRVHISHDSGATSHGVYPSVIGAAWIERDDQNDD